MLTVLLHVFELFVSLGWLNMTGRIHLALLNFFKLS